MVYISFLLLVREPPRIVRLCYGDAAWNTMHFHMRTVCCWILFWSGYHIVTVSSELPIPCTGRSHFVLYAKAKIREHTTLNTCIERNVQQKIQNKRTCTQIYEQRRKLWFRGGLLNVWFFWQVCFQQQKAERALSRIDARSPRTAEVPFLPRPQNSSAEKEKKIIQHRKILQNKIKLQKLDNTTQMVTNKNKSKKFNDKNFSHFVLSFRHVTFLHHHLWEGKLISRAVPCMLLWCDSGYTDISVTLKRQVELPCVFIPLLLKALEGC